MNEKRNIFYDILHHPNQALETARAKKNILYRGLVKFAVFMRIMISEFAHNHCTSRASGIAFVLLITLIPVIATMGFFISSMTDISTEQVEQAMTALLPFAPPMVTEYISTFFMNAKNLRGLGIGVLIILALSLFSITEQSLNSIWKAARARSFISRLRTFTMVVVYSPILFYVSHYLRNSGIFGVLPEDVFLMRILPIAFTTFAFAVMLWFIPNTRVRVSSAIIGGIISCSLFELERWGFGYYVHFSAQTQTIYGTFGLVVFFLLSIYFTALLFLIGAQTAYVHQNFRPLLRAAQRWDRRVGDYRSYITMRIMIDCVRPFIKKTPPPALSYFCEKYELTTAQAMGILNWLIHEKFIHQIYGTKQFVPARDFSNDTVSSVFSSIEDQYHRIPTTPKDYTKDYLTKFMTEYSKRPCEDDMTFGGLVELLDRKEKKTNGK
jgi:membrane protein